MLLFSHKMVFIENEAALLCVTMRERARALQLQSSVQRFDIAFVIEKFNFCGTLLNAFWHGNEAFPKDSSSNEIVALLVVFHLACSKYKGVKI